MFPVELIGPALVVLLLLSTSLWGVSVRRRDASIIDPFWAPAFFVVALVGLALGSGPIARRTLVLVLVAAWAVRLGWHLFRRNQREGEDRRYQAMRATHGAHFWWRSLFTVFWFQSALVIVVGLPLFFAQDAHAGPLGLWDGLGAAIATIGIGLEAAADRQLHRFRHHRSSPGRVLDTGLWRYSRHPNYFGNAVMWWGLGLIGAHAGGPIALVGPAVMTFLLLKVSGVALLERDIAERRPAYRAYVQRTSAFIPWPPKPADRPSARKAAPPPFPRPD